MKRSTCHGCSEIITCDRAPVMPLEVQLHALLEPLLTQQCAVHTYHLWKCKYVSALRCIMVMVRM